MRGDSDVVGVKACSRTHIILPYSPHNLTIIIQSQAEDYATAHYYGRFFFDVLWFILINTILLQIVFGTRIGLIILEYGLITIRPRICYH